MDTRDGVGDQQMKYMARLRAVAGMAVLAAAVSGCCAEHRQAVKEGPAPLDLGVTYKTQGKVQPGVSDALYRTISQQLAADGRWEVHRLGQNQRDFAPVISAIALSTAESAPPPAAAAHRSRLLVLVENAPAAGTPAANGAKYDVTLAYRDTRGLNSVYRNGRDLVAALGSRLFGFFHTPVFGPHAKLLHSFGSVVDRSLGDVHQATAAQSQQPTQLAVR
jgi:hypothetical protein